tara:strand:+ start:3764 stop:6271 length:2508 start_codon:yes stop_codon:yes gene_type:complete
MGLTQVTGKGITDGTIFDVDVHASAAIAGSKITPDFGSQDITTTGNLDLPDDAKLKLGDSDDFDIFHQSSNDNSIIREQGGGILSLQTNGSQVSFYDIGNTVIMAEFNTGGSCSFRHGATTRLATNSTGATVTGNLAVTGTVDGRDLATDGTKLDGIESNATADQTASEILSLLSDQTISTSGNLSVSNAAPRLTLTETDTTTAARAILSAGELFIQAGASGSGASGAGTINLTGYNNVSASSVVCKANTFSVTGNITVSGTVDGVDIATRDTLFGGLTSSSGVLTNGVTATTQSAGDNSTKVATTAYTDTAIANLADSAPSTLNTLNELAAALGDDANFSTTVTDSIATKMPLAGGTFTGDVTFDGETAGRDIFFDRSRNALVFKDNSLAEFGSSNDFQIYHDTSNSHIKNSTGTLIFRSDNYQFIDKDNGDVMMKLLHDGAVELYHDNSKKLETTSAGVSIAGTCTLSSHLVLGDSDEIKVGSGEDLLIYHDGSNSYIKEQGTGNLQIQSANAIEIESDTGEKCARFHPDGEVQLFHNDSQKFATKSYGAAVTGNLVTTSSITIENANHLFLADNGKARFGTGNDMGIFHNGTKSFIENATGDLILKTASSIFLEPTSGESGVSVISNGAVELYHDNSKKLETTSSGVNVTGALTINGAALGGGNPTGTVISYAGSSAPTGYLKANGDSIPNGSGTVQGVTEDFSDLYAIVGSSLPDLRGEFVRGLDDGRGVDSGRSIRSSQGNQNLSHSHTTNTTINHNNNNSKDLQGQFNGEERDGRPTGVFYTVGGRGRDFDGGDGDYIGFDGRHRHGTTSNGGSEARPRNVALLMCIKY